MKKSPTTISELLRAGADDATALSAPGGVPLSYRALRELVSNTVRALSSMGIGRGDRVAIVLENGPEMAAAFLCIGAGATAAPLNPGYRADEFEFYLTDLRAKLLVVGHAKESPCIEVAGKLGVPVARLVPQPDRGAGTFALAFAAESREPRAENREPRTATADDIALVLHTSGTTSRPKIVPLAQKNVCASAENVRESLALTESDRGLVIMPLFHIHGLIAALLAPLSVGGEVCCTPGFNALKFFSWLTDVQPTWYSGVPTMHQAILMRAPNNADAVASHRLRFIRSSSSSLPVTVIGQLEALFRVPVIEAYGMTEAAHQMASNALPPHTRKPGTVGPAAGPEIRIVDTTGKPVPAGVTGEIVIRGPNVMREYENNPKANAEAFYGDWFRTGDVGYRDDDDFYYFVTRKKDIIRRRGENISGAEIDRVVASHPKVLEAAAIGVPAELGEDDILVAVVPRPGQQLQTEEIAAWCAEHLSAIKQPRYLVQLDSLPHTPTHRVAKFKLKEDASLLKRAVELRAAK